MPNEKVKKKALIFLLTESLATFRKTYKPYHLLK